MTEDEILHTPLKITISQAGSPDTVAGLQGDKLGFRPYVEAVYSYLRNEQTKAPFTISIEGEWGTGKSSFMEQLKDSLKNDGLVTVNFNAWRHDKVESMWAAFALHFIKDLLHQKKLLPRLYANVRLRLHRFDWIKGWFSVIKMLMLLAFYLVVIVLFYKHSGELAKEIFKDDKPNLEAIVPILGTAGLIIGLLFFLHSLAEVTGNPFKTDLQKFVNSPNYEGNVAFIEAFHRDFKETVNILSERQDKIYVFVDDLDRADIPKAAELMQGLNMMISNSPKLVFIIGMDREKVAAGIAAKYKDLLPFLYPEQPALTTPEGLEKAKDFGYEFLEKFIQLSFQLPRPSPASIRQFITSLSEAVSEKVSGNTIRYNPVYLIGDGKRFHTVSRSY